MKLKILSWNIWVFGHFDQITSFLKEQNADIIALQEVQEDDPEREVVKYLADLGYNHVFAPVAKEWGGKVWNDGPAIFSKYPIVGSETFILSEESSRAAIRADIQLEDKILHVFSTHLVHTHQEPSEIQEHQVENIIKELPGERTVVMGDFNATPDSVGIKRMCEVLVDSDSDPESLPTWSVYKEGCGVCELEDVSFFRLDYIFTTKDIQTSNYKVESSKASDHLPVLVIIEI